MAASPSNSVARFSSCVRGYHVYQSIWMPSTGEILDCQREVGNAVDRYAIKVLKNDEIVGHLPKKISMLCSLFIRRGGLIKCEVTGSRRYSQDLVQGGLEIPCDLIFEGNEKDINKLRSLIYLVTL